jgi:hypothetical protein
VLGAQARHASELAHVIRNEHEAARVHLGGDQEIHRNFSAPYSRSAHKKDDRQDRDVA